MTVEKMRKLLYEKANELDEKRYHERAHEIRRMVYDLDRAYAEVKNYKKGSLYS